jgi:hypothetical protein
MKGGITQVPIIQQYLLPTYEDATKKMRVNPGALEG